MSYAIESRVQLGHTLASSPLKLEGKTNTPEDLKAVAKQFESIFMNMMLKSMRAGNRSLSEGNYLNSFESNMYEDMLDEKLSVKLSENGGLGIADLLVRQFSTDNISPSYKLEMEKAQAQVFPSERRAAFDNAREFLESVLPNAKAAANALGVEPEFIVAQAALETGWGQQVMFDGEGTNSFNLFGIKAHDDWQGKSVNIASIEVKDGVAAPQQSKFKMYGDYAQAFSDYQQLLSNDRYSGARNSISAEDFAQGLSDGGYATDPQYADKIARVYESVREIQLSMSR